MYKFNRNICCYSYVASGARISSLSRAYMSAVKPARRSPSKPSKCISLSSDGGTRLTHN